MIRADIVSLNENEIVYQMEDGFCPLDFLAEYYRKEDESYEKIGSGLRGKLVALSTEAFSYLVNNPGLSIIYELEPYSDMDHRYYMVWEENEEKGHPETRAIIHVHGDAPVLDENGKVVMADNTSWIVIESLKQPDALIDINNKPFKYAEDLKTNGQIVYLTIGSENVREMTKCFDDIDELSI